MKVFFKFIGNSAIAVAAIMMMAEAHEGAAISSQLAIWAMASGLAYLGYTLQRAAGGWSLRAFLADE